MSNPDQSYERMFHAACLDLAAINEALDLDPDDGGAAPILEAIAELKARATPAPAIAAGVPAELVIDGHKGEEAIRRYVDTMARTQALNQWLADVYGNELRQLYKVQFAHAARDERDAEMRASNKVADLWRQRKDYLAKHWPEEYQAQYAETFPAEHCKVTEALMASLHPAQAPVADQPANPDMSPMPADYGGEPRAGCGLEGAHAKIEWIANTLYAMRHMRTLDITWGGQLITMAAAANFVAKQIAAIDQPAEPSPADLVRDWKSETDDPVAEMDAIMAVYEESMGIEPGPVMSRVVEKTKAMLFGWWGWHRETIRAALVAAPKGDSNG